ncbi:hypothetical protein X534_gp03 [Ralstonia phage RSB3]|uniref:Uncharacterized protein n=1 Tax=Ralstonia phage RSB3 TaxID=1402875 RepID=U3TM10_9CAUD|nr:hypothetical protein X534_gp03 [Ralstonia phage RSB3]BAN92314.1 hypothetical protein [Ralstonia phage RSB3]
MKWIAGTNQPGYMPDDMPAEFESQDEAKRYIIGQMKYDEENAASEEVAEHLASLAEDANLESGEFSYLFNHRVYWVTQDT